MGLTNARREILGDAFRGWLMEKHLPFDTLDAWADDLMELVDDHLTLWDALDDQAESDGVVACEGCPTLIDRETCHVDGEGVLLCDECWDDLVNQRGIHAPKNSGGQCPDCDGTGAIETVHGSLIGNPPERDVERCDRCLGTGTITVLDPAAARAALRKGAAQ